MAASPLLLAHRGGVVTIRLPGDEASDILNFVLKDDATNTWCDRDRLTQRAQPQAHSCRAAWVL